MRIVSSDLSLFLDTSFVPRYCLTANFFSTDLYNH